MVPAKECKMKADQDDIPEYIRNRKKESPWRFVAILGIGSAVFWALAMMFGKPIIIDINQIKNGIHVSGTPWFNQEKEKTVEQTQYYQTPPPPKPIRATVRHEPIQEKIELLEKPLKIETPPEKQTVFNDRNYKPSGAKNIVQATRVVQDEQRTSTTPKEIVVVGKENRPEDWVCSYVGKEGSIKRRECKMRYQLNNRN